MNHYLQIIFIILFSLLVGGVISYWYYYKSVKQQFEKKTKALLFILRALIITALVFLLFNPKIIYTTKTDIKPSLLIAVDNSQSIKYLNDSTDLYSSIQELEKQTLELQKRFNIRQITFGTIVCDTCEIDFSESETNISEIFDYINYSMQFNSPKGIILLSDGNYNKGEPPLNRNEIKYLPVFSVVMGDTTKYPDFWISNIKVNPVAFKNSNFPVEIDIFRTTSNNTNVTINILNKGKIVKTQTVRFEENELRTKINILLQANEQGIQQYDLVLETNILEHNQDNNKASFVVEIIDSDKKALLLYKAPTPDIAIIRQSFETTPAFKLDVIQADNFSGDFTPYNFVIFVQIPTGDFKTDRFAVDYMKKNLPVWFLLGTKTDVTMLNHFNLGWFFNKTSNKLDLAYPIINQNFSYFKFLPEFELMIEKLPPLYVPFGTWKINNNVDVAINQRIGTVETNNPLLLTAIKGSQRIVLLTGEGLWRWNMYLRRVIGNSNSINELIMQVAQFLSSKTISSPFRLKVNQVWQKNNNISIEGYAYNLNYQLINNNNVEIVVTDQFDKKTQLQMSPVNNYYKAQIGSLPVGVYSVTGFYKTDSITYTDKKSFIVSDLNIEKMVSSPQVEVLRAISGYNEERLFYQNNLQNLAKEVIKQIDSKPSTITKSIASDTIMFISILVFIVFCATVEWLVRKYFGQL